MTTPETVEALAIRLHGYLLARQHSGKLDAMEDAALSLVNHVLANEAARQAEAKAATDEAPAGRMTDQQIIDEAIRLSYNGVAEAETVIRLVRANTPPKLTEKQVEAIVEYGVTSPSANLRTRLRVTIAKTLEALGVAE